MTLEKVKIDTDEKRLFDATGNEKVSRQETEGFRYTNKT